MSKWFKILLIVFGIVFVVNGIVYFALGDVPSEKTKPKEEAVIKETPLVSKIPDGIVMDNEQVNVENNNLNYDADVSNKGKNDVFIKKIVIIALNENNVVSEFEVKLNQTLKPKRKIHVSTVGMVTEGSQITNLIYRFES